MCVNIAVITIFMRLFCDHQIFVSFFRVFSCRQNVTSVQVNKRVFNLKWNDTKSTNSFWVRQLFCAYTHSHAKQCIMLEKKLSLHFSFDFRPNKSRPQRLFSNSKMPFAELFIVFVLFGIVFLSNSKKFNCAIFKNQLKYSKLCTLHKEKFFAQAW